MIRSLRKRHLQIWITLAILIPIGIIGAVIVIPKTARDKLFQPGSTAALPIILKTIDKEGYSVNLRSSADTSALQLEWINKKILTYPSALIYQVPSPESDIEKADDGAVIVGRVESTGIYHFPLKKSASAKAQYFILYDIIHHQKIDSLTF